MGKKRKQEEKKTGKGRKGAGSFRACRVGQKRTGKERWLVVFVVVVAVVEAEVAAALSGFLSNSANTVFCQLGGEPGPKILCPLTVRTPVLLHPTLEAQHG